MRQILALYLRASHDLHFFILRKPSDRPRGRSAQGLTRQIRFSPVVSQRNSEGGSHFAAPQQTGPSVSSKERRVSISGMMWYYDTPPRRSRADTHVHRSTGVQELSDSTLHTRKRVYRSRHGGQKDQDVGTETSKYAVALGRCCASPLNWVRVTRRNEQSSDPKAQGYSSCYAGEGAKKSRRFRLREIWDSPVCV